MYLVDIKPMWWIYSYQNVFSWYKTYDEYISIKMYLVDIKPTWWIYFYQNAFTWYKVPDEYIPIKMYLLEKTYVMNIFLSKCI